MTKNKIIEEIAANNTANVASHMNFPLGKPINVTDMRYKKKQKEGKTVLLKRFREFSDEVSKRR